MRIDQIVARSILDSRGRPTIETTVSANAVSATASVPSGKSTGTHEAVELRDTDGSVTTALANINGEIARALVGQRFHSLDDLDAALVELDGTPNKSRLGANAILSVSIAAQRLAALLEDAPLWKAISERAHTTPRAPALFANVLNGGVHTNFTSPFQEYMVVVEGPTSNALPVVRDVFTKLGTVLGDVPMGDEGGYAPTFTDLLKPFEVLTPLVTEHVGASIAIDAAASELYHTDHYELIGKSYTADELMQLYEDVSARFPIHSIEDPFDEESTGDFAALTRAVGNKLLIIGDDFTVTNPARIAAAKTANAINAVLIKPNQIGTVKEAIQAVADTVANGWQPVASHRSGETLDTFIADFAYGVGAHGIKAGGLGQKERLEKYERLLAIEREAEGV